jgi:hypothetical protein
MYEQSRIDVAPNNIVYKLSNAKVRLAQSF